MDNEDLIWHKDLVGGWIRFIRMDRGYSQGQLSALCGVLPSEIHRVEVGQQECRTETLVKLCGPLGVTPGWILDRVLCVNGEVFKRKLESENLTGEILRRLGAADAAVSDHLLTTLSKACSLAAILLRCSNPVSRASAQEYPHEEWRQRFTAFALRLHELGGDNSDCAAALHNLFKNPITELSNQNLLPESALLAHAQNAASPKNKQQDFGWRIDLAFPRGIAVWLVPGAPSLFGEPKINRRKKASAKSQQR
ncbi:MAG TPA: helix-turn-helix transcriptional regulator [Verrucomicrobiae bacterium]|jgi:transcriptional regulator with XRE-family HTH domain